MTAAAPIKVPALLVSLLLGVAVQPANAQPAACANANSTVEMTLCVGKALEAKDRELSIAMQKVATDAAAVPGGQFPTIWKDSLTGFFKTSADPEEQIAAFQQARRNACVYMNSLSVQGTGFGIFVSNCEIRMTDALLQSLN
ncbi:MAG: lysozyme inhibitor LprI family protein [Vulcanococcus sp.]